MYESNSRAIAFPAPSLLSGAAAVGAGRGLNQRLGGGKIEGVRRHLAMVLIAHTLLVLGPVPTTAQSSGSSSKDTKLVRIDVARADACLETIGSRCRLAYREVLVSFIALVLKVGRKLKNDAGRIASLALSSRARLRTNFAKV